MNIGIFGTFFFDGLRRCRGSVHDTKLRCAETSHIWVSNILEQLYMTAGCWESYLYIHLEPFCF
jgi:hypothetical protein